jgi:Domain of unknown function (DUF4375)
MKNSELIEKTYLEAVKGIKEDWLLNSNTNWYDYVVNLPIHLKVTYLVVVLHNQVFNGGFHQYLVNGYGQFVKETIISLLDIGALKKSKLLEVAFKIVNANNVSIEVFRKQLLDKKIESLFVTEELYTPLDELDTEYYNIVDEEIEVLLVNYLESR